MLGKRCGLRTGTERRSIPIRLVMRNSGSPQRCSSAETMGFHMLHKHVSAYQKNATQRFSHVTIFLFLSRIISSTYNGVYIIIKAETTNQKGFG